MLEQVKRKIAEAFICKNERKPYTTVLFTNSGKKGITLIALVITIIILLILAGIVINLTIGQKGILTRAEEAGRNYQEAAKKEDEMLSNLLENIDTEKEPKNHNVYAKVYKSEDGQRELLVLSSNENYVENSDGLTLWKDCGNVGNEVWSEDKLPPWLLGEPIGSGGGGLKTAENLTEVKIVDKISPVSTAYWFEFAIELTQLDVSNLDTSSVTDMTMMFAGCIQLTQLDVSNFDTSKVTNMQAMFGCTGLTQIDISNFDTSNVTDMSMMFAQSSNLTSILVGEKWKEAEKKDGMFGECGVSAVTPKT